MVSFQTTLGDQALAENGGQTDALPTASEIGMQLRRILGTPDFAASTRSARFLAYIVERTLAGEARLLKQYSIATEALGRDSGFDPDRDPLVRLEAGKLRRNLDGYYANGGAGDPIRISVPRGSYVPVFERQASRVATPVAVLGELTPTRLLVVQTSGLGPEAAAFSQGLTEQLTVELARYPDLSVAPAVPILPEGASPASLALSTKARFVVTSSARQSGSRLRAILKLHDLRANAIVWTDSFDGPPDASATFEAQDAIARRVSAEIADFHGVICRLLAFESVSREADGDAGPNGAWTPHVAIQRHRYLTRITNEQVYRLARADLETGVKRTPYSAMMWAALAHTVFTGNCLGFDDDPDFLQAADRHTQRAMELDQGCAYAHVAAATIAMYRRDLVGVLEVCERLTAGNAHAPSTKLSAGFFRSLAGDWDTGMQLLAQALGVIHHPPGWAFRATFLNAYRQHDYVHALNELKTYPAGEQFTPSLLRAAAFGQLGRGEEAALAVAEIRRKWPDFPRLADRYFRYLSGVDALSDHLREGLRKAGLDT